MKMCDLGNDFVTIAGRNHPVRVLVERDTHIVIQLRDTGEVLVLHTPRSPDRP